MKRCTRDHQVHIAADPVVGLSGRKAPSSMGKISTAEVLRLRATSAVSRDQSVRRSAQDDDFCGSFHILNKLALMGLHPDLALVPQHEDRGDHLLTDVSDSLRVRGNVVLEALL